MKVRILTFLLYENALRCHKLSIIKEFKSTSKIKVYFQNKSYKYRNAVHYVIYLCLL